MARFTYRRSRYIDHNYCKILNCKIYFTNYFRNIYSQPDYIINLLYIKHYKLQSFKEDYLQNINILTKKLFVKYTLHIVLHYTNH